jgi:S1-C subfamily serine protease
VIPASIAWKTAATVLEHGSLKRGYLGLAGQPVALPENQRGSDGREDALLVVGVTAGSPAAAAGVLVGTCCSNSTAIRSSRRRICWTCWSAIASDAASRSGRCAAALSSSSPHPASVR